MVKSKISGEIKLGDLIAVGTYGSNIEVGIYRGEGQSGSVQYYELQRCRKAIGRGVTKLSINYICFSGSDWRVVKMSPDCLNEENKESYEKLIEHLKTQK